MAKKGSDNSAFSVSESEDMSKTAVSTVSDVAVNVDKGEEDVEMSRFTPEEEQILEVLREVVRKCTNADPMKRPTAAEVLEMLNKCPVVNT